MSFISNCCRYILVHFYSSMLEFILIVYIDVISLQELARRISTSSSRIISCQCRSKCVTRNCPCRKASLPCYVDCHNMKTTWCSNIPDENDITDEDDNYNDEISTDQENEEEHDFSIYNSFTDMSGLGPYTLISHTNCRQLYAWYRRNQYTNMLEKIIQDAP